MIPFKNVEKRAVAPEIMKDVYEKIKTPYKYGPVLKYDTEMCDSPSIYKHGGRWLMNFIKIDNDVSKSGYDSHLAESDNLLDWNYIGTTLERNDKDEWDSKQVALYAAYIDNELYGDYTLGKVVDKYHFSYLGGNLDGYETVPLSVGQATATDPEKKESYKKIKQPCLTTTDEDSREGERVCIYKSHLFKDSDEVLGYPYVCIYNAKGKEDKEALFLAVSKDAVNWERYGEDAVLKDYSKNGSMAIIGDAQVLRLGDLYIMLYFVLENGITYDTFACSYDLLNWTVWDGKPLVESSEKYDEKFAHKPCLVIDGGTVYHFYCAVDNNDERIIALATSNPNITKNLSAN